MTLLWVATMLAGILVVLICLAELRVSSARRAGRYPPKGKVRMDDVRDLALRGEETLAMRAYRELNGASPKEAKDAIKEIVRSAGK